MGKKNWALKILWHVPFAAFMIIIFMFSAQSAEESAYVSDGLLEKILTFLGLRLKIETVEFLRFIIRKTAHFSLYGGLGISAYLMLYFGYGLKAGAAFLPAVALSFLYAAGDEIHQVFVPGRSGMIGDVCIDTLGSMCASAICFMILRRKKQ